MGRDEVMLENASDEPLELEPGESIPATLLFDPQVGAENVVAFYHRDSDV